MDGKQHGLSQGVRQIIGRLFSDETFKEDALANPELAFANYSLGEEERQALKGLLGTMNSRHSITTVKEYAFWA